MKKVLEIKVFKVGLMVLLVFLITNLVNFKLEARMSKDLTGKLDEFSSAFKKGTYAKNVWDMKNYQGKIYIGQGNSTNEAPDQNAGPIPINYFDDKTNSFVSEGSILGEQINSFKLVNNKLMIPDHDPRESWDYGNFYYNENNSWKKVRTIPKGIHILEITGFKNKIFVGSIPSQGMKSLLVSDNYGKTWEVATETEFGFFTSIFEFKGELYAASNTIPSTNSFSYNMQWDYILKYDGKKFKKAIRGELMIPGLANGSYSIIKPTEVNGHLVYMAAKKIIEWELEPVALYTAKDLSRPVKVRFPESRAIPRDILVRGNSTYVLASLKNASNRYTNLVYETNDMVNWKETLRFNYDTLARSFEELNGSLYFGIGSQKEYISPNTGKILRAKNAISSGIAIDSVAITPTPTPKVKPTTTPTPTPKAKTRTTPTPTPKAKTRATSTPTPKVKPRTTPTPTPKAKPRTTPTPTPKAKPRTTPTPTPQAILINRLTNVALNKRVIVDSVDGIFNGSKAVDGNKTRNEYRWVSENTDKTHYIEIDLGGMYEVSEMKTYFGWNGYQFEPSQYKLKSWDGTKWVTIVDKTNNKSPTPVDKFAPIKTYKFRWETDVNGSTKMYEIELNGLKIQQYLLNRIRLH